MPLIYNKMKEDEKMQKYWNEVKDINKIPRGMYIILPLKYNENIKLDDISIPDCKQIDFNSADFIELLIEKCSNDGDFVRRFCMNPNGLQISLPKGRSIPIENVQLFIFTGGIAFLTVYLSYSNESKSINDVYDFILPGYTSEEEEIKNAQINFLDELEIKFLKNINIKMNWFVSHKRFLLKDAYRMNAAGLPNRFNDTEIIKRITYNEHRIVDLSRDFADDSEKDIAYVTSARDVNSSTYGWGCAITSQEISYAYFDKDKSLIDRAKDDLLLTVLVMYQKYSCIRLNEKIHQRYTTDNQHKRSIRDLKREALMFIAYGTLAPSQISRWNNVCETYRSLIELNGINEAIKEIKEKINLLDEEQARIDSRRSSSIGMIITVFGLISIVGSVMQIVSDITTGKAETLISFWASLICILIFVITLIVMSLRRKKRNGDV